MSIRLTETSKALASITDESLFELLATAVLRESDPIYTGLIHTGINFEGRTVKSPLDGICFVEEDNTKHLVTAHHTITSAKSLKKKWLLEPSTVKPRKNTSLKVQPGDVVKTASIVSEERILLPSLRATLALTTNQEPDQELVREIESFAVSHNFKIDIWSRSRICHFLDFDPKGQWIRKRFLGIEQELLSPELLQELSRESLRTHHPHDNANAWIPRALDDILERTSSGSITLLVAESGFGKTVACYKRLKHHVDNGGYGLVLLQEVIDASLSLDHAIETTLKKLHPALATLNAQALNYCSSEMPLIIVVEDLHDNNKVSASVEKIFKWCVIDREREKSSKKDYYIICPLRPEALSRLEHQVRKKVNPHVISFGGFTEEEGTNAVLARSRISSHTISPLIARDISNLLNHDPLLIALNEKYTISSSFEVIDQFIENSLMRVSKSQNDFSANDYLDALYSLACEMIARKDIDVEWSRVRRWLEKQGETNKLLTHLAHQGELIRFIGDSHNQKLSFRHSRVRDYIFANATFKLLESGELHESIISDPYFAEIIGLVASREATDYSFLEKIKIANPLALFLAFRHLSQSKGKRYHFVLQKINELLDNSLLNKNSNLHLKLDILVVLAQTDSSDIPIIVRKIKNAGSNGELARYRNGDLSGAIEFCAHTEPGVGYPWRDIQFDHVKIRHGKKVSKVLYEFLCRDGLHNRHRIGALRLAGMIADSSLSSAIEICWHKDDNRINILSDYLLAFIQCCSENHLNLLDPVFEAWEGLSDLPDSAGHTSPRNALAAYDVRWALHRWPPKSVVIEYLIQRACNSDLSWPITYLLHGIDHPKAVNFVVHELAKPELYNTTFAISAPLDWTRRQDSKDAAMSDSSRNVLLEIWTNSDNNEKLRAQALSFWAATRASGDLDILREVNNNDSLSDQIIWQRLIRGDKLAIPSMINMVLNDKPAWWFCGRYVWSNDLTHALDEFLTRRGRLLKCSWDNPVDSDQLDSDTLTSEILLRIPMHEAENILLKHWSHLKFSPDFVQAALFVSTPDLLASVSDVVKYSPDPKILFENISWKFGGRNMDQPEVSREQQLLGLLPYIKFLSSHDIFSLWKVCNKLGWFDFRRKYFDDNILGDFKCKLWSRAVFCEQLDSIATKHFSLWIDQIIEEYLEADVPWQEILGALGEWLRERESLEALQLVSYVIRNRGTRKDLMFFKNCQNKQEMVQREIYLDTEYSVFRRTLN